MNSRAQTCMRLCLVLLFGELPSSSVCACVWVHLPCFRPVSDITLVLHPWRLFLKVGVSNRTTAEREAAFRNCFSTRMSANEIRWFVRILLKGALPMRVGGGGGEEWMLYCSVRLTDCSHGDCRIVAFRSQNPRAARVHVEMVRPSRSELVQQL
jgi:hypothetical protein